jgi:hypothetical protein
MPRIGNGSWFSEVLSKLSPATRQCRRGRRTHSENIRTRYCGSDSGAGDEAGDGASWAPSEAAGTGGATSAFGVGVFFFAAAVLTFFAAAGLAGDAFVDAAAAGAEPSEPDAADVAFGAQGSTSGAVALAVFAEVFFFTAATALQ